MSELDTITIKGFKSIASIDRVKLRPINLVIGANGSGKSNFIGVFSFLHSLRSGVLQDYVIQSGGAERILHFGSRVTKQIHIHISFQGGVNQYEVDLVPTESDELIPRSETVYFWNKEKYPDQPWEEYLDRVGKEAGISAPKGSRVGPYVKDHLSRWRLYHFHDTSANSLMKKTASINDNRFLRPDASNLAPFLYLLFRKHINSYNTIIKTIRRVAPFFEDFKLQPQQLNPDTIRLEWKHKGSDAYFDATSLSDGTLRFIALATLFLQPEGLRPSVILVDEPELGLHPYAITLLASLIMQASTKTQVIVSTQSSLLLDSFEPEDVLVANRVEGGTTLDRLDPSKLESWLEEYSLGQLWEKNEFGGRPASE